MDDGFIQKIAFQEHSLSRPDPRSGKLVKGWGQYIIVKHPDGAQTLYAHLERNSNKLRVGDPVKKGDVIARSGETGGASGPHLHVEYSPIGKIFQKEFKADPDPCLELSSGTLPLSYGWSAFLTQGPYFDSAEAAGQYVCNLVYGAYGSIMSITVTGTVGEVRCVAYYPGHISYSTLGLYYVAYCPAGYTQGADSCIRNN